MGKKHPLQILVADDNRVNQLVIVGLLEKLGYQADIAINGVEVLQSLEKCQYDLILMDCHMPQMDGFDATKEICKKYEKAKRPRIVALTASTTKEDIDHCIESGMNGFIAKPIVLGTLIKSLTEIQSLSTKIESVKDFKTKSKHCFSTFDCNTFMSNYQEIEDLAFEAIQVFLSTLPTLTSAIEESIHAKNFKAIELSAHTLKGAVSNFYAEQSRILAWKIEQMGHEKKIDGIQNIFDDLMLELKKFSEELQKLEEEKAVYGK